MKIFLDNNIIIDALAERDSDGEAALELLAKVTVRDDIECFIASKAVVEVHYTIKKVLGELKARSALGSLLCIVDVIDTTKTDFEYALRSDFPDFEDAVTISAALRAGAEYIITRDKEYTRSPIPALTAKQFLKNPLIHKVSTSSNLQAATEFFTK